MRKLMVRSSFVIVFLVLVLSLALTPFFVEDNAGNSERDYVKKVLEEQGYTNIKIVDTKSIVPGLAFQHDLSGDSCTIMNVEAVDSIGKDVKIKTYCSMRNLKVFAEIQSDDPK